MTECADAEVEENRRTGRTPHQLTFAILAAGVASFSLNQSLTVPVLPLIAVELDTSQSAATWVITAYLLSSSVFTPVLGRLGDAVGKDRVLVLALACLATGSLVAAVAPSIEVMIGGRVLTGVGGGVLPLAFGIIRDEFAPERVAAAAGFVSSLLGVGFGVGLVLAGPIVHTLGFRGLFWTPFAVTAVATMAAAALVPPSPVRVPGRIPLAPAILLGSWLLALLVAMSRAPRWGWTSPAVVVLLLLAGVLAACWIALELRQPVPLIDMQMMRLRGVWTTNLVALLVGFSMYAFYGFLPQLMQTPASTGYGLGATTSESGFLILPNAVATFVCGIVAAPLAARIGAKTVVVAGGLLGATGMSTLLALHDLPWHFVVVNSVAGLGIGLVFASLAPLILSTVPAEQSGVANGMNANIRTIGGAIGAAVMSTVVTAQLAADGLPQETSYMRGFAILSVVMFAAALAGTTIPAHRRRAA
ncbi:MFS transporter [Nocardioides currus]|uniref:MFS transporter n=1 Tax=Nocardioides currus TaxID=2133958 RepID=A0A2R7Z2E5_9ACTN|nr:MFS transporter [Nocardioides currus]PUA82815.1 MFS transporter [Nocardioides currus]